MSIQSAKIIIDGYNLLHQSPVMQPGNGAAWLHLQRVRLIQSLARLLTPSERLATLCIFDAYTDRSPNTSDFVLDDIRVHFAHQHHEADDMIEDLIEQHPSPKSLLIVSSDRRIQIAAKYRRAQITDSREWFEQLQLRSNVADNVMLELIEINPEAIKNLSTPLNDVQRWFAYLKLENMPMINSPENDDQSQSDVPSSDLRDASSTIPARKLSKADRAQVNKTRSTNKKISKTKRSSSKRAVTNTEETGIDPKILKRANRKLPDAGPLFPEDYFDGIS